MRKIPESRRRQIRTWSPGPGPSELKLITPLDNEQSLLDLASNDYLNLSLHPKLIEAASSVLETQGIGSGGSRLVTGSRKVHSDLERKLSEWLERDNIFLFPSGYQANIAAVMALANRHTPVLIDRLAHHSLLIGVKASGARLQRFAHNDLSDLSSRLEKCKQAYPNQQPIVLTESLFSMEGTSPSLQKMAGICESFNAKMIVDEAHALGVIGSQGRGLCYGISLKSIGIISGTFGKAFGCGGAFLATDAITGDQLLQHSGAFRYTTALSPPLAAAAIAALELIKANPRWGENLQTEANHWRCELTNRGWSRPPGYGPILSLLIGTDQNALDYQRKLENAGLLCIAIRPPTVPEGTSRLRIIVRRSLPNGVLPKLLEALTIS